MENKRGFLGMIIFAVILLVAGYFVFVEFGLDNDVDEENCVVDDDCVKVQTTCCGCESGGVEKCVSAEEAEDYEDDLDDCDEDLICAEVYNCEIESCGCADGDCVS